MKNTALSTHCCALGSDLCPCVLSTLDECLVCSHLQGGSLCDCSWGKYCVYINYIHDRKSVPGAEGLLLVPLRVIRMAPYGSHIFFSAPKSLVDSVKPLHYLYLKRERKGGKPVPAVILETYPAHGVISVAVNGRVKTIDGPVANPSTLYPLPAEEKAVGGLDRLAGISGERMLLAAGDFGQLLVYTLIKNYFPPVNHLTVLVKDSYPIAQKLKKLGVRCLVEDGIPALDKSQVDIVVSLGRDSYHRRVTETIGLSGIPHLALSINWLP
ncbi:MAG: hypothetical protein JL50_09390 [Peptococcaceae bacterium BICA1-7]|nr:MAG: hypothetical protein JL50_09390 [Peptococcaceae bacterium BICA1-7]HBV95492.1 hypothetical protein [Desulfotomaculum sp.]